MSTRRPNVPRAPRIAESEADVLRPDFRSPKTASPGIRPDPPPASAPRPGQGQRPDSGAAPRKTGATAGARSRPVSAAARRVQERESARYSVRQPFIGWTKADAGTANAGKSNAGTGAGARTKTPEERSSVAGAAGQTAEPSPVPAKSFSGRLLALTVVLITITVLLAPSVRTYVQQQEELDALSAQITALEATRSELQNNLARWEDPAYVKQQARNRLFLVMPGETRYLVMGAEQPPEPTAQAESEAQGAEVPWVDALWQSIQRSATE